MLYVVSCGQLVNSVAKLTAYVTVRLAPVSYLLLVVRCTYYTYVTHSYSEKKREEKRPFTGKRRGKRRGHLLGR